MKIGISFSLLAASLALAGCTEEKEPPPPARPVLYTVAKPREVTSAGFTGTVEARQSTDLGFQVLGRIVARNINIGDMVQKGQELAKLDANALQLAVTKAEADLASSRAKRDLARANEQRQSTLLATNATTKERVEEAVQSLAASDASVLQLEADLTKAQEQLGYATLIAQTDGVVSSLSAEVGQVVAAGQTVATISRLDAKDAVIDVPESYGELTKIGSPFIVSLQANPELKIKGTVREAAPQADAATRTRRTKIALEATPTSYRLGSTVTATPMTQIKAALWLPSTAIGKKDGASFIWVIDPQEKKVVRRTVAVEPSTADGVNITQGLKEGERVVTAGVNSLADNQPVRFAEELPQ
ncbi:efflux RND transporter periplasmic adaptor subunit [Rhizobium sp. FKY42]|uniref:efflux RND transporter periplasmic adaptor subunit n=1 Tax=Rhizobium sp. FKY42 TaxID=2562310 RepID=UPI0010BFC8CD|nr:efflux RND transporter periplasmic adaptor subunit [Rhizobium sp. FKY42]